MAGCIDAISKAYPQMPRAILEKMVRDVEAIKQVTPNRLDLRENLKALVSRTSKQAVERQLDQMVTLSVALDNATYLSDKQFANGPVQAGLGLLEDSSSTADNLGSHSIANIQTTTRNKLQLGFTSDMKSAGVYDMFVTGEFDNMIAAAVDGSPIQNPHVQSMAKIVRKWFDATYHAQKKANLHIGYTEKYLGPVTHDATKIISDKTAWKTELVKRLDLEKTFPTVARQTIQATESAILRGIDPSLIDNELMRSFDGLFDGLDTSLTGSAFNYSAMRETAGTSHRRERQYIWKSMKDQDLYQKKYSRHDTLSERIGSYFQRTANDIGLATVLGPDYKEGMDNLKRVVVGLEAERLRKIDPSLSRQDAINKAEPDMVKFDKAFNIALGKHRAHDINFKRNKIGAMLYGVRQLSTARAVGSMGITQMVLDPISAANRIGAMYNENTPLGGYARATMAWLRSFPETVASSSLVPGGKNRREVLAQMYQHFQQLEDSLREIHGDSTGVFDTVRAVTSKISFGSFFNRLSWIMNAKMYMDVLAKGDLTTPQMTKTLKKFGITPDDVNYFAPILKEHNMNFGLAMLDTSALENNPRGISADDYSDIINRGMGGWLLENIKAGSPIPTASTARYTSYFPQSSQLAQQGTVTGEAWRYLVTLRHTSIKQLQTSAGLLRLKNIDGDQFKPAYKLATNNAINTASFGASMFLLATAGYYRGYIMALMKEDEEAIKRHENFDPDTIMSALSMSGADMMIGSMLMKDTRSPQERIAGVVSTPPINAVFGAITAVNKAYRKEDAEELAKGIYPNIPFSKVFWLNKTLKEMGIEHPVMK